MVRSDEGESVTGWNRRAAKASLAVLGVAAVLALAGCTSPGQSQADSVETKATTSEATTASATPSATPSPSQSPTASAAASPTSSSAAPPTTAAAPAFTPLMVTDDDAVEEDTCTALGWRDRDSGRVAGVDVGSFLMCDLVAGGANGWIDYLVPVGASTLTVLVGQLDTSEYPSETVRFEVSDVVTADVLATADLRFGQSQEFVIDVAGRNRVRFSVRALGQEDFSGKVMPAWVEPTFS